MLRFIVIELTKDDRPNYYTVGAPSQQAAEIFARDNAAESGAQVVDVDAEIRYYKDKHDGVHNTDGTLNPGKMIHRIPHEV